MMIVAFESEQLRAICEDESVALSNLPTEATAALRMRLADLRAVSTILELPVDAPTVSGEHSELITFDLGQGVQMVWTANHVTRPMNGGAVNWDAVSRIRLVRFQGAGW